MLSQVFVFQTAVPVPSHSMEEDWGFALLHATTAQVLFRSSFELAFAHASSALGEVKRTCSRKVFSSVEAMGSNWRRSARSAQGAYKICSTNGGKYLQTLHNNYLNENYLQETINNHKLTVNRHFMTEKAGSYEVG